MTLNKVSYVFLKKIFWSYYIMTSRNEKINYRDLTRLERYTYYLLLENGIKKKNGFDEEYSEKFQKVLSDLKNEYLNRKINGEEFIIKTSYGADFKILEGKKSNEESKINMDNLIKKKKKTKINNNNKIDSINGKKIIFMGRKHKELIRTGKLPLPEGFKFDKKNVKILKIRKKKKKIGKPKRVKKVNEQKKKNK